jgi:GNAT superfamily N-acetyltransferase
MGTTPLPSELENPETDPGVQPTEPTLAIQAGNAVLVDGSTIGIKSLHADDRDRLVAFFDSLSMESRRRRFFSPLPRLEGPLLERLLDIDHTATITLVAERHGEIVGVGGANRIPDEHDNDEACAEVAFVVSDKLQGFGIGTLLLEGLASRARVVGITNFIAVTQADNGSMLRVFRNAGYHATVKRDPDDPGLINISFPIEEDESSRSPTCP